MEEEGKRTNENGLAKPA